jgi:acetyl-CoA carboxylase biotin carboxyl carrier protein
VSGPQRTDEVEALIAEFKASGMRELHVRLDEFELYLSSDPAAPGIGESGVAVTAVEHARPAAAARPAPAAPVAQRDTVAPDGLAFVRAPYMGTFYRSPKPGAPVFVDVGSDVTPDTDLCLVEVMKLFTAVRAPTAGRIHAVLAADGQMVEAGQPLFELIPA